MNIHAKAALLALCISALVLPPAPTLGAEETEIRILCSNGMKAAVEKLLPEYERSMGRRMKVQFGTSANLQRSIENGEPFDLAILTQQIVGDLIREGRIAPGSRVDIASSGIGIAFRAGSPKPDVTTPEAIKQTLLKAKSIAYVKEGATTPAIVDMFHTLGISQEVQNKVVFEPGAERNMASVAAGQAEVAFGLVSEIVPAPGVQLAGPVPPQFQKPITMSAGIARSTKNREAVNKLIQSLKSAEASSTIKATGLEPAPVSTSHS
jgi:molybdate transport system substrate-binding protein